MTSPAFSDVPAPDAGLRIVRVAVCGGGVAGVSVAEALLKEYNINTENYKRNNDTDVEDADEKTLPLPSNIKLEVHVFEMGRQLGGRCSTRRPRGFPQFRFDHGHQYITAMCGRDVPLIQEWEERGLVRPWLGYAATAASSFSEEVEEQDEDQEAVEADAVGKQHHAGPSAFLQVDCRTNTAIAAAAAARVYSTNDRSLLDSQIARNLNLQLACVGIQSEMDHHQRKSRRHRSTAYLVQSSTSSSGGAPGPANSNSNEQENHCAAPCLINPSVATGGANYYVTPSYEVVVSSRRGSFGGPTLLQTKEEHQTKEPAAVPGGIPTIVVQDQEQDGGVGCGTIQQVERHQVQVQQSINHDSLLVLSSATNATVLPSLNGSTSSSGAGDATSNQNRSVRGDEQEAVRFLDEVPYCTVGGNTEFVRRLINHHRADTCDGAADAGSTAQKQIFVHLQTRVIPAHKGSHLFVGPRMQQLFGAHYEAPWTLRRFMDDAEVGEKARTGKNEDAFNFDTPFDFVVGADRLFLSIKGGDICFSNRTTADFFEPLNKVLREEIGNLPVFSCMVAIRDNDKRAPDHRSGSSEANTAPHALFHGMNFVNHPILHWASLENSKREDFNNLGMLTNCMKNGNDQQDTDTALFVVLSHAEWTKQRLEELESDVQFELEVQDYHGRYEKRHPLERGVEAQVVQPEEVGGDQDAAASSKIQTYFEIYRDRCNQVCENEVYPAFLEELRCMYCAACTAGGEHQESQPFAERFEVVFLQCHRWGAAFPEIRPGFLDRLRKLNGIPSSSSAGASGGSASPGLRTDLRVRSQSQNDVKNQNVRSQQEGPIRESQTDSWYSEKYQFGLCGDFFTTRPGRVLAAAHSGRALGREIRKKIAESAANELQSW